jgi:hypothetical protein
VNRNGTKLVAVIGVAVLIIIALMVAKSGATTAQVRPALFRYDSRLSPM